jgi:hypothetical protein
VASVLVGRPASNAKRWADAPPEVIVSNEEIAKELLSVLKDKMMYREGLPSDGWAVEVICNALVAAQPSVQPTVATGCPYCGVSAEDIELLNESLASDRNGG